MKRRLAGGLAGALVVAAGLLATGAAPAFARAPTITYNAPAAFATLGTPVIIDGQAQQNGDRVDSLTMSLSAGDPNHPVPSPVQVAGNGGSTLPFHWEPALPYNGSYTVSVQAVGTDQPVDVNGSESSPVVARTFSLEIPPAAPAGLHATASNSARTITLAWNANTEPDLWGYAVYRKNGNAYEAIKSTAPNLRTYTDSLGSLPAGTYSYQVRAVRQAATANQAVLSAPSSTTGTVTTAPPQPTTTTTRRGTGGTATTSPGSGGAGNQSSNSPNLATSGRVDLSTFAALLDDKTKLPAAARSAGPQELDTGFNGQLPFNQTTTSIDGRSGGAQALGGQPVSSSGDERSSSLLFLAAGLLVTVVLMHVLWLKGEVEKEPLPAVSPSESPDT